MTRLHPVLACAAAAAAVHALILMQAVDTRPAGQHEGSSAALTARAVVEPVTAQATPAAMAPGGESAPAQHATSTASPSEAATARRASPVVPDAIPPRFVDSQPIRLAVPDAPMPEHGVRLRAYVEVEDDGTPGPVQFAPAPGADALHPSFETLSRQAMAESRFERDPSAGPGAYCLEIVFEPGAPAPRLLWLAGAAGSAPRCLTGPAVTSRDLGRATPP